MPLTRHAKKLGSVDWSENGSHTLRLARDGVMIEKRIRMRFTITHGVTPSTGPKWYALAALIKRMEVTLNGRDTVMQIDGPGAVMRAIDEYGVTPYSKKAGAAASSFNDIDVTASTATAYDIIIPVPFYFPHSQDPLRAALPLNRFGQATLELTYGDVNDLFTSVNAGTTITSVTVEVEGDYLLDVNPERPFLARILDQKNDDLPGTTDAHDITIDTGTGLLYRSVNVVTISDSLAVDTILAGGSLALEAGTFTFQKRDAEMLQADNAAKANLAVHQTGVYSLKAEKFGNPSMLINTDRQLMHADLKLIADATKVGTTDTFKVYREAVRPFKN